MEGLIKGAIVGLFVDGAAIGDSGGRIKEKESSQSKGESRTTADALNNACKDVLQRARRLQRGSAVGLSIRAKGLRADVGWAVGSDHATPRLYIGVDDK